MNGRRPELLIPASNLEVLKVAVMFGADAVYIGGEAFGLTCKSKEFFNRGYGSGNRVLRMNMVYVCMLR